MSANARGLIVLAVIAGILVITCIAIGAPPFAYLIILGVVGGAYLFVLPFIKQVSQLESEGKVRTRDPDFIKTAQIYTIRKTGMNHLIEALKYEGLPFAGLEWKTGNDAMGFRYGSWTAEFYRQDGDDSTDVFRFCFTGWQTMRYGTAEHIMEMNQLLTAIEKAVLRLDPNTKVKTEIIQTHSKTKFF